jgi:putative flavoprotein involved in K+ transport
MTALMTSAPRTSAHSGATTVLDVLVIGAGQAGLALGYHLRAGGVRFELVDRNARIGDSWRQRFESLSLFTPRSYSHLPGLRVDGDQNGYASRDEIADYLAAYRSNFEIPVRLGTAVEMLERIGGRFLATLSDGSKIDACAVVVAAGAFPMPAVPSMADGASFEVAQFTPLTYRNPSSVPPGVVLVVGDGATGRQIALELAGTHRVLLATGKKRSFVPRRLLGRSIFWWLDHLGFLRVRPDTRLGRRLRKRDSLPRRDLRNAQLRAAGIELVSRLTTLEGARAGFSDGESRDIGAVVWATGYRDDTTWMGIAEAISPVGSFLETEGVSPVASLFFVGRPWQLTQSSGLLTGVGADAERIAILAAAAIRAA